MHVPSRMRGRVLIPILILSCTLLDAAAAPADWATADNGQDINWQDAKTYCARKGSGWRLPTLDELRGLHADAVRAKQGAACGDTTCQAPPRLRLSAPWLWSSTPVTQDQARDFDELAWGLTLVNGRPTMNLQFFAYGARALCVRGL